MAFSNGYTIGFATVVCVICSTTLAGVSMGLKERQEANARRDLCKNILLALDLPEKDGEGVRPPLDGEAVDKLWDDKIELVAVDPKSGAKIDVAKADLDGNGSFDHEDLKFANDAAKKARKLGDKGAKPKILGLFIRKDNGTVAVPMDGAGLWGPISGYVAFDPKMTTVQGTTFFAPKETPGLGAKITKDEGFEKRFLDKTIVEGGKTVPIRVLKSAECDEVKNPHCVDGISGATITSRGVDEMIAKALDNYEPYFKTVRK